MPMKKWPYPIARTSRLNIFVAVRDPKWIAYRKRMHGLLTENKLEWLEDWLIYIPPVRTTMKRTQVACYLNSLRRAGYLDSNYAVIK